MIDFPTTRIPFRYAALGLTFVTTFVCGCGDGRPLRVPVSGQVRIDGRPLQHGYVRFVPSGARASKSKLSSDGRFSLHCFEPGDGAVLATHQIEVCGMERIHDWEFRLHAPKKYADLRTSGLTKEIKGPENAMLLELSWEGEKPFTEIDESARPTATSARGR